MKRRLWLILMCCTAWSQTPAPQDPVHGIVKLFDTYRIVMLGEIHDSVQEHELLRKLVASPAFTERVNDIVMEFGNARYQDAMDRYIAGASVPIQQVQKAWQNTVGAIGPLGAVYPQFYATIRKVNKGLPKQRRLRVLLGDPPIDWSEVRTPEDLALFLPFRDEFYASVVRYQVLAKRRKALLVIGSGHLRRNVRSSGPGIIESQLLNAAVKPYIIMPGSNMVNGFDDLDRRFDQWPAPWLMETKGTWIGGLPMLTPVGTLLPGTREEMADAFLYLGPRDSLTALKSRASDLEATAYGRETQRRLAIRFDRRPDTFLPKSDDQIQPLFSRTASTPPPLRALPKPRP